MIIAVMVDAMRIVLLLNIAVDFKKESGAKKKIKRHRYQESLI